jgi:hypothetical protein
MTSRRMVTVAAGAILAAALCSCSSGPAPFGHPTSPGGQCIPLAGAKVVTDGLEEVQNHATTTAVIDRVALRRPKGLVLDRAWVVPSDGSLYGAAYGYPPQFWRFKVPRWHWHRRMLAAGARVPPLSSGGYQWMNIVVVVRLAPGFTRGRAAGIDMWYHVADNHYHLAFQTALAADIASCEGFS